MGKMTDEQLELCRIWDVLNMAIGRVETSQPHGMTAAAEELEVQRKRMEKAIMALFTPNS